VVPSLGALVAAAALLARQPVPRGRRVAVIGNTRGMVGLTVQACVNAELDVVTAENATPGADTARLGAAVAEALRGDACDALILALAPTAGAVRDIRVDPALTAAAERWRCRHEHFGSPVRCSTKGEHPMTDSPTGNRLEDCGARL